MRAAAKAEEEEEEEEAAAPEAEPEAEEEEAAAPEAEPEAEEEEEEEAAEEEEASSEEEEEEEEAAAEEEEEAAAPVPEPEAELGAARPCVWGSQLSPLQKPHGLLQVMPPRQRLGQVMQVTAGRLPRRGTLLPISARVLVVYSGMEGSHSACT